MAPGWARSNSRRPRLRPCRDHRAALLAKRPCLDSRTVPSPESKAILARRSSGSSCGIARTSRLASESRRLEASVSVPPSASSSDRRLVRWPRRRRSPSVVVLLLTDRSLESVHLAPLWGEVITWINVQFLGFRITFHFCDRYEPTKGNRIQA